MSKLGEVNEVRLRVRVRNECSGAGCSAEDVFVFPVGEGKAGEVICNDPLPLQEFRRRCNWALRDGEELEIRVRRFPDSEEWNDA